MWLESIKKAIEKLEAINPKNDYAYERAILALVGIKDLPILTIDIKPGEISSLYRTRTHETPNLFQKVSDVSIPPNSSVKYFARCNRPHQSVFYCAEDRQTSYAELVEYWVEEKTKEPKLFVSVGKWKLKKTMKAVIVTTPDASNRISKFDKQHGPALDEFIYRQTDERKEALIMFYRYLWDKFRKPAKSDPKTYLITTAYSNIVLMQTSLGLNAIYYPSVPLNGQGINFAINSEFVNYENLEPLAFFRTEFTIEEIENKKYNFKDAGMIYTDKINVSQNRIIWPN